MALRLLFERAHSRARELAAAQPGWPCARGCDACCKRLAREPHLTRSEWALMREAWLALEPGAREACLAGARVLAEQLRRDHRGPYVCPFLDASEGACRIYDARPLACRTYGFYASHHHDAWCEHVAAHVSAVRERLIFGNLDAIERALGADGDEARPLLAWLLGSCET